jgi:phage replication initiation protein
MSEQLCIIDYLSFTWCPDALVPLRRIVQAGSIAFSYSEEGQRIRTFADLIKAHEQAGEPLDVGRMEYDCLDALKTFFMSSGKDLFANCEYNTADLWEDHFQLIERGSGVFGYRRAFDLVLDGHTIGLAATGAAQGSCYISLTGKGCRYLDMSKTADLLRSLPFVKLTRVDIALDDFAGATGFEHARSAYIGGDFITRGKPPVCGEIRSGGVMVGDTIDYQGGSTFTVGTRAGGKLYRGYEKGKQQGDPASLWFRHEVELRSANREIPLHVLTDPDRYFAGFYPYTAEVLQIAKAAAVVPSVIPCKRRDIQAAKRTAQAALAASIENLKRVGGGVINVLRESCGMTDSEITNLLIRDAVPRSLSRVAVPGLVHQ